MAKRFKDCTFKVETVEMKPAPVFSWSQDGPSLATIYSGHFDRLQSIVAAARTGDPILIGLALDHHDKHGSGE